mgnify:CR=1 FL=1
MGRRNQIAAAQQHLIGEARAAQQVVESRGGAQIIKRGLDANKQRAVAVLERLEKAEPRNGLALFYLGAASFAAGDKPAAARRWKTLLALLPADAPIRAMLEERIKAADSP